MKICAGIHSVEGYLSCAEAGADEVYCGYVPPAWLCAFGPTRALNRREVAYCNVQIGSREELKILKKAEKVHGVPVTLTFNSPFYGPDQVSLVRKILEECLEEGFSSFIVADPQLMILLQEKGLGKECSLQISGEASALNRATLDRYMTLSPRRVIFGRKTLVEEMSLYVRTFRHRCPEWEAFVLNENCFFSGWSCCSLHCDEMNHVCRLPGKRDGKSILPEDPEMAVTGAGGCGLCALWKLKEAGVTHLKIVSRGAFEDDTAGDVAALRQALNLLAQSKTEEDFVRRMKEALFPDGCSHRCYYG